MSQIISKKSLTTLAQRANKRSQLPMNDLVAMFIEHAEKSDVDKIFLAIYHYIFKTAIPLKTDDYSKWSSDPRYAQNKSIQDRIGDGSIALLIDCIRTSLSGINVGREFMYAVAKEISLDVNAPDRDLAPEEKKLKMYNTFYLIGSTLDDFRSMMSRIMFRMTLIHKMLNLEEMTTALGVRTAVSEKMKKFTPKERLDLSNFTKMGKYAMRIPSTRAVVTAYKDDGKAFIIFFSNRYSGDAKFVGTYSELKEKIVESQTVYKNLRFINVLTANNRVLAAIDAMNIDDQGNYEEKPQKKGFVPSDYKADQNYLAQRFGSFKEENI